MFFPCSLLSEQQFEIPQEEAEWLGLNLEEALEKQRQLEHKVNTVPKHSTASHFTSMIFKDL